MLPNFQNLDFTCIQLIRAVKICCYSIQFGLTVYCAVVLNTLESCNLRRTQICTQFEIINLISLDTLYKYSIQKIIRLLSHISLYLPLNFTRPVKWSRLSVICLHVKLATLGLDHIIFDLWGMLAFKRRFQAIEATITVAKY